MKQYRVSDVARADLDEIWVYIAQDNPDAADRLIRAIVSRFPMLASMPEMGRQREELAARLHSFPIGNYIIFYHLIPGGVVVTQVCDGRRDLPSVFRGTL